jgi:hypothetical protein
MAMMRFVPIVLLCLLAACGGLHQPFGKDQDGNVVPAITAPPWEAMVAAGPGAANDIDLETLNGPTAAPPEIPVAEAQTAPPPKAKSSGVEIKAVAVVAVKGASAMGNGELTRAMRQTLAKAGWTVLNAPARDALTIIGQVTVAPPNGSVQTVALKWEVQTPDGRNLGDVKQSNSVPSGSLDAGWGENAGFATEAAATGIYELINKYR